MSTNTKCPKCDGKPEMRETKGWDIVLFKCGCGALGVALPDGLKLDDDVNEHLFTTSQGCSWLSSNGRGWLSDQNELNAILDKLEARHLKELPSEKEQKLRLRSALMPMAECIVDEITGETGEYHNALKAHVDAGAWSAALVKDKRQRTMCLMEAVMHRFQELGLTKLVKSPGKNPPWLYGARLS